MQQMKDCDSFRSFVGSVVDLSLLCFFKEMPSDLFRLLEIVSLSTLTLFNLS